MSKFSFGREYTTIIRNRNYGYRSSSESAVTANAKEKILNVWKKYFNYSLMQTYFVEKNCTHYKFDLHYKTPKWLQAQLKLVSFKYANLSGWNYNHIFFYEYDKDYLFYISFFSPYEYTVSFVRKQEGMAFIDSYDMIQKRDFIMRRAKRFLSEFKIMDHTKINDLITQVNYDDSFDLLKEHQSLLECKLDQSTLININNLI